MTSIAKVTYPSSEQSLPFCPDLQDLSEKQNEKANDLSLSLAQRKVAVF